MSASDAGELAAPGAADVAVVGGGLAGWMAAVAAQESGARVVLIERSRRTPGWGNSMISGGALHAALMSPWTAPAELVARAASATDGVTDPDIAEAWARGIPGTLRWIEEHGGRLVRDGAAPHRAVVFAPVRRTDPGLAYRGKGVPRFLGELSRRFRAEGGRVVQPARAREIERDAGRGWRLKVCLPEGETTVPAATVILADGGFQANPELLRRHIGTSAVRLRATGSSTGDALSMGQSVGAAVCHMDGFYGHLLVREALTDGRFWPYPILDGLASSGVVVDSSGRRFVDETHSGVTTTNAVARRQRTGGPCWVVFDAAAWEGVGRAGDTPPNPYLTSNGARVVRAATIDGLAAAIGVEAPNLREAVRQAGVSGRQVDPPRECAVAITTAPYFAVDVVAGVTFTLGGLRADGNARVLDDDGRVLTGLYAVGGTMGGLHGGPRDGYVGGLLEAAVFGLIAGRHAATTVREGGDA